MYNNVHLTRQSSVFLIYGKQEQLYVPQDRNIRHTRQTKICFFFQKRHFQTSQPEAKF